MFWATHFEDGDGRIVTELIQERALPRTDVALDGHGEGLLLFPDEALPDFFAGVKQRGGRWLAQSETFHGRREEAG